MMELTSRQREVLQLIGQGKRTKEIAELLRLSIKTVEFHKNCIMKELGIHITIGLAHFATEPGHASGS
jgi:DNA-binding NarL/FixJ family response regulator